MKDDEIVWASNHDLGVDAIVTDKANNRIIIQFKNGNEQCIDFNIGGSTNIEKFIHSYFINAYGTCVPNVRITSADSRNHYFHRVGNTAHHKRRLYEATITMSDSGTKPVPPQKAEMLLQFILSKKQRENIIGCLEEEYVTDILPKYGKKVADKWYWTQVSKSVWPLLFNRLIAIIAGVWKYFGA